MQLSSANPEILKVLIVSLKQKTDTKTNPNWIDLTIIPVPKDAEPEEKVMKNKTSYHCSYCKKWSLRKNHATATCNKKKKLGKSQATLKANLASLLSQVNDDDHMFSHVNLGMHSHGLYADAEFDEDSYKDEKYDVISITNSVMEDLYKNNGHLMKFVPNAKQILFQNLSMCLTTNRYHQFSTNHAR